jgi:peptidoglycan/xylan/chitin deacetylase (PgdA/CDA1 family)
MRLKKVFFVLAFVVVLIITGFFFFITPKYVVPILMYHHLDRQGGSSSLSVSPENFRRQMDFLARHKYNVISLAEFVRAKENKEELSRNTVVITFDDGYADNYIFAYPILQEYNLPATIFVIVNAVSKQGYLDYAQIREMADSEIITIGSHTLTGAYLPGREISELKREIGISKRRLQVYLNKDVDFFCYPIGGFTPWIQEIVKKNGYKAACTTNRGTHKGFLKDDIFALKRIKVKESFGNLFVFWVKVSGYYNLFRRVRDPH